MNEHVNQMIPKIAGKPDPKSKAQEKKEKEQELARQKEEAAQERQRRIRSIFPDDVYRYPWMWRSVSRDEACGLCESNYVVVEAQRNGWQGSADWLTPRSPYYAFTDTYRMEGVRYWVFVKEGEKWVWDKSTGGGSLGELPPNESEPDYAPPPTERSPREEEPEDNSPTLPVEADAAAIAAVLKKAAEEGIPFCEECAKAARQRAS